MGTDGTAGECWCQLTRHVWPAGVAMLMSVTRFCCCCCCSTGIPEEASVCAHAQELQQLNWRSFWLPLCVCECVWVFRVCNWFGFGHECGSVVPTVWRGRPGERAARPGGAGRARACGRDRWRGKHGADARGRRRARAPGPVPAQERRISGPSEPARLDPAHAGRQVQIQIHNHHHNHNHDANNSRFTPALIWGR